MSTPAGSVLALGALRLDRLQRRLLHEDNTITLERTAFDVLHALAARAPSALAPAGFRRHHGLQVDDATLWQAVCAANAALGIHAPGHFIVQGARGDYRLAGPVSRFAAAPASGQSLIGRQLEMDAIAGHLRGNPLVTIVGPGGIGKTTLATAVATAAQQRYACGACVVDLAPLVSGDDVLSAVAASLGVRLDPAAPAGSLADYLQDMETLLVLDNCEHVIDAAAHAIEQLLRAPRVHVLATSREPLRARAEKIVELDALDLPPANGTLPAQQALAFGAVQLFVRAAREANAAFDWSDESVADTSAICRFLEGMPLAIELAAGQSRRLRLPELRRQLLASPFSLLVQPRATRACHTALQATLEWSYQLLEEVEREALRRLAIFRGPFPLRSAIAVGAGGTLDPAQATQAFAGLAAKSLLSVVRAGDRVDYRMLETTRVFALQRLAESGEHTAIRSLHAKDCQQRLVEAEAQWQHTSATAWCARHARLIDEVRSCLDWALAVEDHLAAGCAVLLAALPLVGRLALIEEFTRRAEGSLRKVQTMCPRNPGLELRLTSALSGQMFNQKHNGHAMAALKQKLDGLVREMADAKLDVVALNASWMTAMAVADYPAGVRFAVEQLRWAQARGDSTDVIDAQRQLAYASHLNGQHRRAASLASSVLRHKAPTTRVAFYSVNQIDHRVAMRIVLSRVMWLEGRPEHALATIQEAIPLAEVDRPTSLCQALAFSACQLAMWTGDDTQARAWARRLEQHAVEHDLPLFRDWALVFQSVLDHREGIPFDVKRLNGLTAMQLDAFSTLTDQWMPPLVAQRQAKGLVKWCGAEILRVQGEIAWDAEGVREVAERHFDAALGEAQAHGALSWALRAATSLARLAKGTPRSSDSRAALETLYGRFREGHKTRDLRAARALLDT